MNSAVQCVLSVDLGGTKVAVGLVGLNGQVLARREEPTCQEGPQEGIRQIVDMARGLLASDGQNTGETLAIGVGIPAVLAPESDHVIWAPNLHGWRDVPLPTALEQELGLPAFIEYDGHTAVLGEWWQGAGQGYQSVAMLIVGTGIGGGLILDGRLFRGRDRLAGAAGWFAMTQNANLQDTRGASIGHWESLAAGPGIAARAQAQLKEHPESALAQRGRDGELTAKAVFEAAREGDAFAQKQVRQAAELIGLGVANVISLVNPEIVVLGGSVGRQSDLLPVVRTVASRWAQPASARSVRITSSALGADAGLLGAAYAAILRRETPPFQERS